jgi:hypothetical protein
MAFDDVAAVASFQVDHHQVAVLPVLGRRVDVSGQRASFLGNIAVNVVRSAPHYPTAILSRLYARKLGKERSSGRIWIPGGTSVPGIQ